MFKKIKYFVAVFCGLLIVGCSSGPYDLHEKSIKKEEKTLVSDTIKTVTENREVDTIANKHTNGDISNKIENKTESFTFIVQIGAFMIPYNFERFYGNARSVLGNEVYYELINNLYKIRIGNYNNKAEALQQLSYVKTRGYDDAFVITVRNK